MIVGVAQIAQPILMIRDRFFQMMGNNLLVQLMVYSAEMGSPCLDNVKQMCLLLGRGMLLQPVNMSHLQNKHRVNMNLHSLEGVIHMSHLVDGMPNLLLGDQSMVDLVIGMSVIVGEVVLTGNATKTDLEVVIIGGSLQNLIYCHL
uniref:Uncharacterized protein n=1 Tax=Picea sitchensis TaxID=3332 RepID=D5A9G5_PICSI|nr:unknown [Picea sitchensis]